MSNFYWPHSFTLKEYVNNKAGDGELYLCNDCEEKHLPSNASFVWNTSGVCSECGCTCVYIAVFDLDSENESENDESEKSDD